MRKICSLLLFLCLALPLTGSSQTPAQARIANYYGAVALMYGGPDTDHLRFHCTATAFERISTGYLFVSASHCVDGIPDGWNFYLGDEQPKGTRYLASVLAQGDQTKLYDFAVLYISAPAGAFNTVALGHNPEHIGEALYAIASPEGIGRSYMTGIVSILSIQDSSPIEEDGPQYTWTGNIGFQILGEGPGASGSTIMCAEQNKVCMILIGHLPGVMVAEPIERFKQWWSDVKAGKIAHTPPVTALPEDVPPSGYHQRPGVM